MIEYEIVTRPIIYGKGWSIIGFAKLVNFVYNSFARYSSPISLFGRSFHLRLKFKLGDIVIIVTIAIAAILIMLSFYQKNTIEKTAVITQNNTVLGRIRLDHVNGRSIINYEGPYPGTIEAVNGKIRFSHAECPDQICVQTGWITRPGQISVCLPAGVIVKIEGNDSELDIIIR